MNSKAPNSRNTLAKVALMLAITVSTPTWAQPAKHFGVPDCGEWIAANSTHQKAWLMGYLSGMNSIQTLFPGSGPKNPLGHISSANQAYLWMDNWCKANPLKNVAEGAFSLFAELMENKAKVSR